MQSLAAINKDIISLKGKELKGRLSSYLPTPENIYSSASNFAIDENTIIANTEYFKIESFVSYFFKTCGDSALR